MNTAGRWLAVLLAAALAGCGSDTDEAVVDKAAESGAGQETRVEIDDNGMRIEAEGGALSMASGASAKVPEGFPDDVYVYESATVQMAMESPQGYTLSLTTSDAVGDVADSYVAALEREGWSRQTLMDMGGQRVLVYEKGARIANVAVAAVGETTQVTVTVAGE